MCLLGAAADANPEAFAADEAWLVGHAETLRFAELRKLLAYWRQHAAPDDEERRAARRHRNRKVHLSPGLDGTGFCDVELEPIGYTAFTTALHRIEHELWEADWADARRRRGDAATTADLARTDAQRRYDALIAMAHRATAAPPDARLPRPLVTVHIDHQTLSGRICELSGGTVLAPGQVLPLLTDADIERAVFDLSSRDRGTRDRRSRDRGSRDRSPGPEDRARGDDDPGDQPGGSRT